MQEGKGLMDKLMSPFEAPESGEGNTPFERAGNYVFDLVTVTVGAAVCATHAHTRARPHTCARAHTCTHTHTRARAPTHIRTHIGGCEGTGEEHGKRGGHRG